MPIKETQIQKECRIKSAGLGRYIKEYNSYCKEVLMDKAKIQKCKDEGKDQHTINKMVTFNPAIFKILTSSGRSSQRNRSYVTTREEQAC